MKLPRPARPIHKSPRQIHQVFLRGKGFTVPAAPQMRVLTAGPEYPGFPVVRQIRRQNLFTDTLPQGFVLQREKHFHTQMDARDW